MLETTSLMAANAERPVGSVLTSVSVPTCDPDPAGHIHRALGHVQAGLVLFFASPGCDFAALARGLHAMFPRAATVGCTTAGELGPNGYDEDTVVAVAFPAQHFACAPVLVSDLHGLDGGAIPQELLETRIALSRAHPDWSDGFAFLAVDGLSRREDQLLSVVSPGLGTMPLFGGSAGDGRAYGRTFIALDGEVHANAAIVTPVITDCETRVFSVNHMTPETTRMVVTDADPDKRLVREINAAPAAAEYARIIGKDPAELDETTFANHPLAVRLAHDHHVRAIQSVTPEGELVFYAAVDVGMVLSLVSPGDIARHLDRALKALGSGRQPSDILGCDCILRRIEAERRQASRAVSDVLARHRVIGFSTYGEQIGLLHVSQTMTGVAIYPPRAE